MNHSYRLGILVILGTLALAALVSLSFVRPRPGVGASAAQDLGASAYPLGSFHLTERSGQDVTESDLADRVWIGSFIFTRCSASCPKITLVMKGLQTQLRGTDVRLVSLSVDPTHDTPEVLSRYASSFGAEPGRWLFLTGRRNDIYGLILDRFKVPVSEASPEDRQAGAEAVSHSARLALVDRGNRVVGYFDANDSEELRTLVRRAKTLDGGWALRLPAVNASLNGASGLLLLVGWFFIRAGRIKPHIICMVAALGTSAAFLTCYLIYHYQVGSVPFRGVGGLRVAYFTILLSHTVLAIAIVPLVTLTLVHAVRKQFKKHAPIARVTFPIWLYVSITGVVVYWMLYRLDVSTSLAG